jgi:predicted phage-related endonuclease
MLTDKRMHWLDARRFTPLGGYRVTASDISAILGWHPARTALDVYAAKVTGDEIVDTVEMMMGREFEPSIARIYASITGRTVVNQGDTVLDVHPNFQWLAATCDRHIWEDAADVDLIPGSPLEIKHANMYKSKEWADGCPLWVEIQNQVQQACTSSTWGAYCGVVGGTAPKYGDIDFSHRFFESIIPKLEMFIKLCENGTPPEPSEPRDLTTIKELYPLDSGETVHLGKAHEKLADEWEKAKADRKTADDKAKVAEAKLRKAIGDATWATLPDGTLLTLTTTKRKDGVRYRTMRRR